MTEYDPRRSLDDIRRYGDSTRDAYVRHAFATPYALVTAVMLFIVYAAVDLPSPWRMIVVALGLAVGVGAVAVGQARAPVRRRPSGAEIVFCVIWGVALVVVYGAARILAYAFGLPVPGIVAAGVLAVASGVAVVATRPLYRAMLRNESRHG
ncbi:MAG TPA: hypothetical protein VGL93_18995 [Streptosporangiaceae bacterium]|jgi:hypothetical protein